MIKKSFTVWFFWALMVGVSSAGPWELDLSAGENHLAGGVHYKSFIDSGFLRFGGTGVYTNGEDSDYRWVSADLTAGNDTAVPGLSIDLGLRGILGEAEQPGVSGDMAAVGFSVAVAYLFSENAFPLPLEILGSTTWAPDALSFGDAKLFFQTDLGIGLRVIKNASILLSYSFYHLKMEEESGNWNLKDRVLRAGLVLRF